MGKRWRESGNARIRDRSQDNRLERGLRGQDNRLKRLVPPSPWIHITGDPPPPLTPPAMIGRRPPRVEGNKKRIKPVHMKRLSLGSDCSGWCAEKIACDYAGIPCVQSFACDYDKDVKTLILDNYEVDTFIDNVHDPAHKLLPSTDIYVAGFPCQPYSIGGGNGGAEDERASVVNPVIDHIGSKKPKFIILENVLGLATKTHIGHFQNIMQKLRACTLDPRTREPRYLIHMRVVNSMDFNTAQDRKRIFIVGIRRDLCRKRFMWPAKQAKTPLKTFYDTREDGTIARARPEQKPEQPTSARNLKNAIKKIKKKGGVDPRKRAFIIDIQAGATHESFCFNKCPTITARRGEELGFYNTYLGRPLSLTEMAALQGVKRGYLDVDGISSRNSAGERGAVVPPGRPPDRHDVTARSLQNRILEPSWVWRVFGSSSRGCLGTC